MVDLLGALSSAPPLLPLICPPDPLTHFDYCTSRASGQNACIYIPVHTLLPRPRPKHMSPFNCLLPNPWNISHWHITGTMPQVESIVSFLLNSLLIPLLVNSIISSLALEVPVSGKRPYCSSDTRRSLRSFRLPHEQSLTKACPTGSPISPVFPSSLPAHIFAQVFVISLLGYSHNFLQTFSALRTYSTSSAPSTRPPEWLRLRACSFSA